MLTWDNVLEYIKGMIALPSSFIEKTDEEIKNWIINTALREFSDHFPDIAWGYIDPTDTTYQTEKENVYRLFDDENLNILGVRDYYYSASGFFATGHPIFHVTSFGRPAGPGPEIGRFALSALRSNMIRKFSYWGYTAQFFPPNYIRVLPALSEGFLVEYERMQPSDLRKIPSQHHRDFMELALAETMIWIGQLRSHYGQGQIQTPFGEIPLQGDMLKSDGTEKKREIIDRLQELSLPGIMLDVY